MTSNRLHAALLATLLAAPAVPGLLAPVAAQAQTAGTVTLHKVTFQGNQQVPTAELEAALPVQPGQKIDHDALQTNMTAIQGVYARHNVGASITARMVVFHHNLADVTYVFEEKAPVAPTVTHVGITADTVGVTGNSKVKTADILAACGIHPGDTVTNEKITAAQTAITGLYKKAGIGATVSTDWTNAAQAQHINMMFKIVEKAED